MSVKYMKLGDMATYLNGYAFKPAEWSNKGTPIIRIQNLTGTSSEYNFFNGEVNERYHVKNGDILISWSASLGVYEWSGDEAYLNQHIFKVVFDKEEIDKTYFKYVVQRVIENVGNFIHGSTMKHITKGDFDNLKIPIVSLKEQKKIAQVLDKAQTLINKRKEAIVKLDELLKSRFSEMFGDPINNPKGWEIKKLKTISKKILSGSTPKGGSEVYVDEGIMFFRSQNVWKNKVVLDDIAYIDKETHDKMEKSSLKNRDILITKTGRINTENSSLGRAAMFLGEDDSANINGHVYLIRLQKEIVNEFVLFILTTDEYREYIRSVCVGGIDKRQINKEHLEEFPIICPPIKLQNQFTDFVKQVNKLKFEMEAHLKEMENNFNALLQQAFKGELSIKNEINA
ncbi:Type I restriction modification DNA specificity domain-containing protein [Bacillus mycoides]|uniref:restriction endonuclease subunit S n=1 Tax=Bacillus mycoides TaxID=1405 RepID=UPI0008E6DA4C|nr:restriction endonuclease subunit S [Bacillus mycoides]SFQ82043.1 Type I restriction modification DNA specificity domain-containing protein [Bacillus mycoides]